MERRDVTARARRSRALSRFVAVTTFDDAWHAAEQVDGWLLKEQGRALFDAAARVPAHTVAVEIGSHRGKSATLIALGLPPGRRLTAVDPFDDPRWGGGPESLEIFQQNMAQVGVTDRVDLFRGLSAEASAAWSGPPVGFLWVDGAHDLASTLADFDGWLPHMVNGGELYVHDAFSAVGTTQAILRRFWFSPRVRYTGCERTLVKFTVGPLPWRERVWSSCRLATRLPFFLRVVAIKISRRKGWKDWERRFMKEDNEPLI
jgi:MMP 1-O-methyltransferase